MIGRRAELVASHDLSRHASGRDVGLGTGRRLGRLIADAKAYGFLLPDLLVIGLNTIAPIVFSLFLSFFALGHDAAAAPIPRAIRRGRRKSVDLPGERIAASYEQAVAADDMSAAQRALLMRQLPEQIERMVEIPVGEPWVAAV